MQTVLLKQSDQVDASGQSRFLFAPLATAGSDRSLGITRNQNNAVVNQARKKKIVLVDDDPAVLKIYKSALARLGFDVLATMSDGLEIVETIGAMKEKPEVIILDERMPRMSGIDACKKIRSSHPEISVVFVSADSAAERGALAAGASRFLTKPVSISTLADAIDTS